MGGVPCEVCGKLLRTRYNLRLHMAVHTGDKSYICPICHKGFQQKWNLVTHISRIHEGDKPFHCKECIKAFGYASHFKAHMKAHFVAQIDAPDTIKQQMKHPHSCDQCTRRFKTQRLLDEHLRNHRGEILYTCNNCSVEFPTRRQIGRHIRRQCCSPGNAGKSQVCRTEPTPCEICGKVVARYSMAKHLNIHTRRRTYACNSCDKTFLEAGHLSTHMRSHSGIKPHICEVCEKAHSQKGNLLAHMRRHHGLSQPLQKNKTKKSSCKADMGDDSHNLHNIKPILNQSDDRTSRCHDSHQDTTYISNKSISPLNNEENNVEATEKLDKPCTGSETIHDFLKIADEWISARVEESKKPQENENMENNTIVTSQCVESSENSVNCCAQVEEVDSINAEKISFDKEDDAEQSKYDAHKELLSKIMSEIECNTLMTTFISKALKKKTKDIVRALIRKLGDKLPINSIVERRPDGSYLWKCWDCQASFKTKPLLLRHRYIHAPPHFRPHRCQTCNRTFTQAGNLQYHLLVHQKQHRFFCERCGARFRHKTHFKTHQLQHDNQQFQPRFQCDTCGKTCSTRSHLSEHIRTHTKERPYLCTCGQQYAAYSTYARHLRQHSGKKVSCTQCGKLFTDNSSRRRHEKTHRLSHQFECACGKFFTQKASLRRHLIVCVKDKTV